MENEQLVLHWDGGWNQQSEGGRMRDRMGDSTYEQVPVTVLLITPLEWEFALLKQDRGERDACAGRTEKA